MEIKELRNKLEQQKGQRDQIKFDIEKAKQKRKEQRKTLRNCEKAREIIRRVGSETQEQLQYHISGITSLAMTSIFNDPYEVQLEFIQRRNKNECDIWFKKKNGTKIEPLYGSEGGAADVAAFALRVASWSMQNPKTRNVLFLDESFKHLKGEKQNKRMLMMLNEISQKLRLQIIMISDERVPRDVTIENSDKLFEIEKQGDYSIIKNK